MFNCFFYKVIVWFEEDILLFFLLWQMEVNSPETVEHSVVAKLLRLLHFVVITRIEIDHRYA